MAFLIAANLLGSVLGGATLVYGFRDRDALKFVMGIGLFILNTGLFIHNLANYS